MNRLYQKNVYQQECHSMVTEVKNVTEDLCEVALDQTVFFPVGGGQSSDTGYVGPYRMLSAFDDEERDLVWHRLRIDNTPPKVGDTFDCHLDWEHRFENMQRHCGEHILSGAFHHLFGGVNRGFHMSETCMTIDIRIESGNDTRITPQMALEAENLANETIQKDLPISVRYFKERKEAEEMPLRKALAFEEDISIVTVGSLENPADCVACCGTHPSTSGQVGLVKVYKVEKNKDMYRIYFDAGKNALHQFQKEHEILTALGSKYSSGIEELAQKLSAHDEKMQETKDRLTNLSRALAELKAKEIAESDETVFELAPLTIEDGLRMAKKAIKPFFILSASEPDKQTLLLCSDGSIDCDNLVKEHAKGTSLRGGGKATSARIMGPPAEIAGFLAAIKQA